MEALETLGVEEDENAETLSKCFSNMSLLDEQALTAKLMGESGNEQVEQIFQKTFVSTKVVSFSDFTQNLVKFQMISKLPVYFMQCFNP